MSNNKKPSNIPIEKKSTYAGNKTEVLDKFNNTGKNKKPIEKPKNPKK